MSYLTPLRLHFAGKFQASPSTVNNNALHFNNATFQPSDQRREAGQTDGWWNPSGDALFRLAECKVTSAFRDGMPVSEDPVLTMRIADTDRKAPGKMADLDPEQQMVSEIWGLEVRICTDDGKNLLRGEYETTAFTELWARDIVDLSNPVGDSKFSAVYQTVLTNVEWFDTSSSPFLEELRKSTDDSELSIKFNVDGYDMTWGSPFFTYGRIVGTIGPQRKNEPKRFTLGRHLMPNLDGNGNPIGQIFFCPAVVDKRTARIIIDAGNSLPTNGVGGPQLDIGNLWMAYRKGAQWQSVGEIDYLKPEWYSNTAGVVALPADRTLTRTELAEIADSPIALFAQSKGAPPPPQPAISEPENGQYVRADRFVFRLNPGEQAEVELWATQWGRPQPGAPVTLTADPSGLQAGTGWPNVAVPLDAISFPPTVTCDNAGRATFSIKASAPNNPRCYIDGQVYGVRPLPAGILSDYPVNPWDFVSLLVWDQFVPDDPITWYGSLQPIFQQYANLYPVMQRFLDLSSFDSICANLQILCLAFGLNMDNPNSMPVTRDLSASKRKAILKWLTTLDADGKPALGTPKPNGECPTAPSGDAGPATLSPQMIARGGKEAAMLRRKGAPNYGVSTEAQ